MKYRNIFKESAKRTESLKVKELEAKFPAVLLLRIREAAKEHFQVTTTQELVAIAVPCEYCLAGNGPSSDCVVLPGIDYITQRCCTNCLFTSKTQANYHNEMPVNGSCEFVADRQQLEPQLYEQSVPVLTASSAQSSLVPASPENNRSRLPD
jgi:hypothetical protein